MNVGREYLGGVRRDESIIKAYCTKKQSIFNFKIRQEERAKEITMKLESKL